MTLSTKEEVLTLLEKYKGEFVSSSLIIQETGVSRNAIWKVVNELKKTGYDIKSVTNRGYCLNPGSDVISIPAIAAHLADKIGFENIAERIAVYDELESTNTTAKIKFITGLIDKDIIIARRQTGGKGHGSEKYKSPEGGVYISFIIRPDKKEPKKLCAAQVGKAVSAAIEAETGKKTELDKNTNRIYISGKKISGILTEYIADLETGEVSCYIIGIGVKMKGLRKNSMIAGIIEAVSGL